MSDIIKRPGDEPLFSDGTPFDELRALLRSAYSQEEIAEMSPQQLVRFAQSLKSNLEFHRGALKIVAAHVASGRLSREVADAMTPEEIDNYRFAVHATEGLRAELDGSAVRRDRELSSLSSAETKPPEPPAGLPTDAVIGLLGNLVTVIAAQQSQIDELVDERDAFLAQFATRILDRVKAFSDSGATTKGFEVTLDLEDEHSERREESSNAASEVNAHTIHGRDTHGELKLLASQVAGLGAGRKVNIDEMNRKVAQLTLASKSAVRARRKGKITVKVGELSGKKSDDS